MAASILTPITLITTTIVAATSSPSLNSNNNDALSAAAAAVATTATTIITDPSTSAITFASSTPSSACDCTQLRYAVIALSTILGTLVLSVVVFVVVKAKRWTWKGARARDGEVGELKRQREDAEMRGRERGGERNGNRERERGW